MDVDIEFLRRSLFWIFGANSIKKTNRTTGILNFFRYAFKLRLFREMDIPSRMSSPLTPLSSLDDSDDSMLSFSGRTSADIDDLAAAQVNEFYCRIHHANLSFQLLCSMATARKSTSL